MSKRVCCDFRGCTRFTTVPDDWSKLKGDRAYCTIFHRDCDAADSGLYLKGVDLGHPASCPGCGGSGVEDNDRWGGGLALCSWPHVNGEPVSGEEARRMLTVTLCTECHIRPAMDPPNRNLCQVCVDRAFDAMIRHCACGQHLMNAVFSDPEVEVIELDQNGHRHGWSVCPDTPCGLAVMGWRCTRGFHLDGPCAAVPDGDHMVDAMRYAMQHAGAWRVSVIEKPVTDRWWFWVGAGALVGAIGGFVTSLFW